MNWLGVGDLVGVGDFDSAEVGLGVGDARGVEDVCVEWPVVGVQCCSVLCWAAKEALAPPALTGLSQLVAEMSGTDNSFLQADKHKYHS